MSTKESFIKTCCQIHVLLKFPFCLLYISNTMELVTFNLNIVLKIAFLMSQIVNTIEKKMSSVQVQINLNFKFI